MLSSQQQCIDALDDRHLRALALHRDSASTIDVYDRAVRRVAEYFDDVPTT